MPVGPGISYNQGTGVLTVTSGAILNLTGTSYYFSQVVLVGNSQLVVNPPITAADCDCKNSAMEAEYHAREYVVVAAEGWAAVSIRAHDANKEF